jgi:hypothetical protein
MATFFLATGSLDAQRPTKIPRIGFVTRSGFVGLVSYVDKILKGGKAADPREAAHEVRAGDQPQDSKADRGDDSAERAGAGG